LDGYLDKQGERSGCEEGEELCDICGRVEEEMEELREEGVEEEVEEEVVEEDENVAKEEVQCKFRQQERERRGLQEDFIYERQQEFTKVEWLRQQLQWWARRCGVCEAAGVGQSNHDLRQCQRQESGQAKEMVKMVEGEIRFEAFGGCFGCGIPQEICNRWEENGQGRYQKAQAGSCQYKGVMVAGLFGIIVGYKVWGDWEQRLREIGVDLDSGFVKYLGQKQRLEVVESNNLVGEFCWITRFLSKEQ
jgi:hypothetical protein